MTDDRPTTVRRDVRVFELIGLWTVIVFSVLCCTQLFRFERAREADRIRPSVDEMVAAAAPDLVPGERRLPMMKSTSRYTYAYLYSGPPTAIPGLLAALDAQLSPGGAAGGSPCLYGDQVLGRESDGVWNIHPDTDVYRVGRPAPGGADWEVLLVRGGTVCIQVRSSKRR